MYEVGQLIYTIIEDKHKVMPLKISEQVITKTLEGEKTVYKAILPGSSKKVILSKLSNVWTDVREVKKHMLENASKAIDNMLIETEHIQKKYFLDQELIDACKDDSKKDIIDSDVGDNNNNSIKIDLGGGQVGNLKINNLEMDQKKNEEKHIASWRI